MIVYCVVRDTFGQSTAPIAVFSERAFAEGFRERQRSVGVETTVLEYAVDDRLGQVVRRVYLAVLAPDGTVESSDWPDVVSPVEPEARVRPPVGDIDQVVIEAISYVNPIEAARKARTFRARLEPEKQVAAAAEAIADFKAMEAAADVLPDF